MKHLLIVLFLFCFVTTKAQMTGDSLIATPNPFINRTLLQYSFSGNDTVTISVLNLVGQTMLYVFTGVIKPAGAYQDSLLMDAYPPGIYFVKLTLGHRASRTVKVIKQGPTLLADLTADDVLMVYPNPFSSEINFTPQVNNKLRKLTIYNSVGQAICTADKQEVVGKIDLDFLEKGIYFLRVYGEGSEQIIKLVKE